MERLLRSVINRKMRALIIFVLICVRPWIIMAFSQQSYDRVRLQDVPRLTFRSGFTIAIKNISEVSFWIWTQATTYSSTRPLPIDQLQYVVGNGLPVRLPLSVTCDNMGHLENGDIQWKCSSEDLDPEVVIEAIGVYCDGYDSDSDPYIFLGSCMLRYKLKDLRMTPLEYHQDFIHPSYQLIAAVSIGIVFLLSAVVPTVVYSHIIQKRRRLEERDPKKLSECSPLSSDVN
jgi:hypothetical protein